jgi:hypothetical protein
VSERDTKRDEPVQPGEGRDIPHGTDEHADADKSRRERGGPSKAAPQAPERDPDRGAREQ